LINAEENRLSIQWTEGATLPAMFRIEGDGREYAINGEMQNGSFVLEGLPKKLVFRLDEMKATATRVSIRRRKP
jgi:hypothetical protein